MNSEQFLTSRRPDWEALSALLDRSQGSVSGLTPAEVSRLGQLYRAATSDLALAQRDFPGQRVTVYLNQLVGRAHAVIYRAEPVVWRRLLTFFTIDFPRAYRSAGLFVLLSAVFFFGPAIASGVATYLAPETAVWLMPAGAQRLIPAIEDQDLWIDIPVEERPFASSFVATNNIRVSFLAFAGGMLAGIFTLIILVNNGLLIGSVLGLTSVHGVGWEMANFVVGHGVVELSVITIAGGAGLMIGWAILRPGLVSRSDAIRRAAREALKLTLGCVPLLLVAGLIEGFISPNESIPPAVKWAVGFTSGGLMYAYLLLAGRRIRRRPPGIPAPGPVVTAAPDPSTTDSG